MQHNDDMIPFLSRRQVPPKASPDLAARIIHAAVSQVSVRVRPGFWGELMAMFALPHPSVAITAGVFLGLALGLQASDGLFALQDDWSSFLYINEGGWL